MIEKLYIYTIRTAKLTERAETIETTLKTLKEIFPDAIVETIDSPDPENIKDLQSYFTDKLEKEYKYLEKFFFPLHINQISNSIKHVECMKAIAKTEDKDAWYLVLEDDVMCNENVCERIQNMVKTATSKWDLMFLGLHPAQTVQKGIEDVMTVFPALPACDSYLIKKEAAEKISEDFFPACFGTNLQLTYICDKLKLNMKFINPPIFTEASKTGKFTSTLSVNNIPSYNREYIEVLEFLRDRQSLSVDELKEISEKLIGTSLKDNSCEFLHLLAKIITKMGNEDTAFSILSKAYERAVANHGIVNRNSQLLNDYINAFGAIA